MADQGPCQRGEAVQRHLRQTRAMPERRNGLGINNTGDRADLWPTLPLNLLNASNGFAANVVTALAGLEIRHTVILRCDII